MAPDLPQEELLWARQATFDVARAVKDASPHALVVLRMLLRELSGGRLQDSAILLNLMTALQFAAVLQPTARDWEAPTESIMVVLSAGLAEDVSRQQAEGLLWALINNDLAGTWIDIDPGSRLLQMVETPSLRSRLDAVALDPGPPPDLGPVESWGEFPRLATI